MTLRLFIQAVKDDENALELNAPFAIAIVLRIDL